MRKLVSLVVLAIVAAGCTPNEGDATTTTTSSTTSTTSPSAVSPLDPDGFFVNLIWHQHQPLYPKDENGVVTRPWVRVHATKDYYDMAAMTADYDGLRVTFNLTPVLLRQLEDIVAGTKDSYWVATEIPADELSDDDKAFIAQRFFDINPKIIDRFPRYRELRDLRDDGTEYSTADWRDLQLLWNLGWTDPRFLEEEPLKAIVDKGRDFTEQDKSVVLATHLEIVGDVVDIHRELWDAGSIEVTTTPLAHPILPLVGDTDQALVGDPSAIMPTNRFREINDAVDQVALGLSEAERILGRRPSGMWPGEGSVSQLVTPIWANQGVTWIATGEHVLGQTLGTGSFTRDSNGTVEAADVLYRPYAAQHSRVPQLPIFFRDVELADRIGFEYSGSSAGAAADDFMGRLENIRDQMDATGHDGLRVVTIVVDGENAWENYDNDGIDFLDALYTELSTSDWVTTVTPSQLLEQFPDSFDPLPDVFPASWFQPNFATWIGEAQEAKAWDYLFEVRDDVRRAEAGADPVAFAEAYETMLFAEGSDWFWWYGSDQESGDDGYFDAAYRELLGQVYDALGEDRPSFLRVPIIPDPAQEPDRTPTGLITIPIGEFDDVAWDAAGLYGGTPPDGTHPLQWAFDEDNLYLRVDELDGSQAEVYLGVPSAMPVTGLTVALVDPDEARVLGFDATHVLRVFDDGTVRLPEPPPGTPVDIDAFFESGTTLDSRVEDGSVEFAVPLEALGAVGVGDRLSILVVVDETGANRTAPEGGRGELQVPDISNVEVLFSSEDPIGDDHGPGSYTYPTDTVFQPGSYDLTTFTVGESGDDLAFEFTVAAPISNPWDSPTGLSIQTFDVYVDVDPGSGTGSRTLIDGRNGALAVGDGWERAITVEGWEPALFTATSDEDIDETLPTFTTLVFGDQSRVVVRLPRSLFPEGDPSTWGYAVAVMSQEGFPSSGVRRVRDVDLNAQQYRLGGSDGSLNATRIVDLLWPEGGVQEDMLTPASSIASGDLDDLTPDDFGQISVLVMP